MFLDLICNTKRIKVCLFLLVSFGLSSCNLWQKGDSKAGKSSANSKKIAQVGSATLYADELQGVAHPGMMPKDSVMRVKEYINAWVKREVMLDEARNQKKVDKNEIKQKVQQFEYDLLRSSLEKQHVVANLDTLIKEAEINAFYQKNKEAFVLKENIIRGVLLKIPLEGIQRDSSSNLKISQLLTNTGANRKKALRDYCVKSAEFYHIEDSTWVGFEMLINNTPFSGVNDKPTLLNQSKFQVSRRQDKKYVYYLKVRDFKLVNQETPYEFAKSHIIELILQKRKVKLIKKLEEDLLKKAQKSKKIKIY